MKVTLNVLGILLIVIGITSLAYQGITYTKREKIAQFGEIQVTADTQKTVYFPPIFGVLSVVTGIVLIVIGRKK